VVWRKKEPEDEHGALTEGELLAPYEATRVPTGANRTGLPPRREPKPSQSAHIDLTARAPVPDSIIDLREGDLPPGSPDRRGEPRFALAVPAAATYERGRSTSVGRTVNVSSHGMLVCMPEAPPDTHLDFVVGDERSCAVLWAKVVAHRADKSDHYWHVRIVSADDAWTPIVLRA